jgi:hypothetical protein
MKEDIDRVSATEQSQRTRDENVKVVDFGYENFAVGVVHRGSTRNPSAAGTCWRRRAGRAVRAHDGNSSSGRNAGRHHSRLPDRRLHHVSGGGTMFTDGYIVNGRHNDQNPQGTTKMGRPAVGWRMT